MQMIFRVENVLTDRGGGKKLDKRCQEFLFAVFMRHAKINVGVKKV